MCFKPEGCNNHMTDAKEPLRALTILELGILGTAKFLTPQFALKIALYFYPVLKGLTLNTLISASIESYSKYTMKITYLFSNGSVKTEWIKN